MTPGGEIPLPEGLVKAPELTGEQARLEAVNPRRPIHDRRDVQAVHLGAMYELVGIPDDLLLQYCIDVGRSKHAVEDLELEHAVCTGLRDWNNLLQLVPVGWAEPFNHWMLNQLFVRRVPRACWWRPRRQRVDHVPDPVLGPTQPKLIEVWYYLPFGNFGRTELVTGMFAPHMTFDRGAPPYEGTEPEARLWRRNAG